MSNQFRRGDKVAVKFDALVVVESVEGNTVTVTHPAYEVGSPLVVPADRVSLLERPLPSAIGTVIRVKRWWTDTTVANLPSWIATRHKDGWAFAVDTIENRVRYQDSELTQGMGIEYDVVYDPETY